MMMRRTVLALLRTRSGACMMAGLLATGSIAPAVVSAQQAPPATPPATPPAVEPKSSDAAINQYRAAVAFQNKQVFDLAIDEWTKFLEKYANDPLAPAAQHYLGVCQFQLGKFPEAEASFSALIAKHPNYKKLNESYINLGLAQFNQGQQNAEKLNAAATTLKSLLEKFPMATETSLARYYLAESLYGAGKKAESIPVYEEFLKLDAKSEIAPKALYGLGVAQQETNQADKAGETYATFLKTYPDSPLATEIGMRQGETLMAAGKFQEAAAQFAAAAGKKDFALAPYALLRQAGCLYELKKYGEAAALYAALVQNFPQSEYVNTATVSAAKCYYLADDLQTARSWLTKAQALPGEASIESSHWLARSFLREKQPAEALATASAAVAKAKDSPMLVDLLLDEADALYDLPERRAESVAKYAAIVASHGEHASAPQAAYMAAFASLGSGKYDDALAHCDAFMKKYASSALEVDVQVVQAEAQLLKGAYADANASYAKLLASAAERPEAGLWTVRSALALQLQKKPADAIALLEPKAATLSSPELIAEGQFILGGCQLELKKFDAAIAAFQAAAQAAPQWRRADEVMLGLARAQQSAGKNAEAQASLSTIIAKFPQSALLDHANYRLGEVEYDQGKFEPAAAAYAQVVEKFPQSTLIPAANYGLGWSLVSQGKIEDGQKQFTKVIDAKAEGALGAKALYARSYARQQLKDYAGALEDVTAFLKTSPTGKDKLDALYVQGRCQSELKKPAEAIVTFDSILKEDPKYPNADRVLYELAWANLDQNKPAEASELFSRLGKEYPESALAAESLFRVGDFLYSQDKFADAAATLATANEKAGKTPLGEQVAHKLAWSQYRQKEFAKSQATFAAQVAAYPQGTLAADAQIMAGESYFQDKKYKEALAAFETATTKPSSDDFTVVRLLHGGQAAAKLEQWDKSLALLSQCEKDFPDTPFAAEVKYEKAWALQHQNKNAEALELFNQIADDANTDVGARARFMAGEILFAEKKYEDATKAFVKVAYGYGGENAPEAFHAWQANALYEAARCFEARNQPEQAKKFFKELVDRFPKSDKAELATKKLGG